MNSKDRRTYQRRLERLYGEEATKLIATAKLLGEDYVDVPEDPRSMFSHRVYFNERYLDWLQDPRTDHARPLCEVRYELLQALHEKHQRETPQYQTFRPSTGITQTRSHNPRGLRL